MTAGFVSFDIGASECINDPTVSWLGARLSLFQCLLWTGEASNDCTTLSQVSGNILTNGWIAVDNCDTLEVIQEAREDEWRAMRGE